MAKDDKDSFTRLESTVENLATTVHTLAKSVVTIAEKQEALAGHLTKLDATKDRVPFSTLLSLHAAFVATLTVSLTIVVIIGTMALSPVRATQAELQQIAKEQQQFQLNTVEWKGHIDERTRIK